MRPRWRRRAAWATAMNVIGFSGQTAIPNAAGTYIVAVNPTGVGLIAAMVPGKDFGLMATTLPAVSGNTLAESPCCLSCDD